MQDALPSKISPPIAMSEVRWMQMVSKQLRRRVYKTLAIAFAVIALLDIGLWVFGQFRCEVIVWNRMTGEMSREFNVEMCKSDLIGAYRNVLAFKRIRMALPEGMPLRRFEFNSAVP